MIIFPDVAQNTKITGAQNSKITPDIHAFGYDGVNLSVERYHHQYNTEVINCV